MNISMQGRIMKEVWKDIPSYEGYYSVSNLGRVMSHTRKIRYPNGHIHTYHRRFLRPRTSTNGYQNVALQKNKNYKSCSVHRLVAKIFVPNPENLPQVNHIDGNKTNNNASNLEWCSPSYNVNHAIRIGLKKPSREKRIKCIETGVVYKSISEAARKLKCSRSNIRDCVNGKQNTALGKHFQLFIEGGLELAIHH